MDGDNKLAWWRDALERLAAVVDVDARTFDLVVIDSVVHASSKCSGGASAPLRISALLRDLTPCGCLVAASGDAAGRRLDTVALLAERRAEQRDQLLDLVATSSSDLGARDLAVALAEVLASTTGLETSPFLDALNEEVQRLRGRAQVRLVTAVAQAREVLLQECAVLAFFLPDLTGVLSSVSGDLAGVQDQIRRSIVEDEDLVLAVLGEAGEDALLEEADSALLAWWFACVRERRGGRAVAVLPAAAGAALEAASWHVDCSRATATSSAQLEVACSLALDGAEAAAALELARAL